MFSFCTLWPLIIQYHDFAGHQRAGLAVCAITAQTGYGIPSKVGASTADLTVVELVGVIAMIWSVAWPAFQPTD